jgi:hypothetical protein
LPASCSPCRGARSLPATTVADTARKGRRAIDPDEAHAGSDPLRSGVPALLRARNATWEPRHFVVSQGATIELKVVNSDRAQHSFTLEGGSISKIIPAGGQTLVKFGAPGPGKVRFYCKYQQQEMQDWNT